MYLVTDLINDHGDCFGEEAFLLAGDVSMLFDDTIRTDDEVDDERIEQSLGYNRDIYSQFRVNNQTGFPWW